MLARANPHGTEVKGNSIRWKSFLLANTYFICSSAANKQHTNWRKSGIFVWAQTVAVAGWKAGEKRKQKIQQKHPSTRIQQLFIYIWWKAYFAIPYETLPSSSSSVFAGIDKLLVALDFYQFFKQINGFSRSVRATWKIKIFKINMNVRRTPRRSECSQMKKKNDPPSEETK